MDEIRCVGCGCTDSQACVTEDGVCFWVVVIEETRTGLCSACAALPIDVLVSRALASKILVAA